MSDRTYFGSYLGKHTMAVSFPDCVKTAQPNTDTLVLALGNPLRGDDGVGVAVLLSLVDSCGLPPGTTLRQCSLSGLIDELLSEHYRRAIIIDAIEMGVSPGTWIRFQMPHDEVTSMVLESCEALHDLNLVEVLALGEALHLLPLEIVVYGIQPQEAGWGPTMSKPVQVAVEKVKNVILEELSDR